MKSFPKFLQKTSREVDIAVRDGTVYEFADFRLLPDEGLLYRAAEQVPLTPKAFETLLQLVKNHGHLVLKSELMDSVWPDTYVEEAVLSRCVWTIRQALGDGARTEPHFIQTVPKRGYKFIAEVSVVEETSNDPTVIEADHEEAGVEITGSSLKPSAVDDPLPPPVSIFRARPVALAAGLVVFLGLIFVGTSFVFTSRSERVPKQFAVLPLKPIDTKNRSEMYEAGIAESVINRLNAIQGFVARPLSAVRNYSSLDQDAVAAGREQKVDLVIAPNYQIADGKVRVTAQLINVGTGLVEDTFRVDASSGSIFDVQDAVADEIAKKLMSRFDRSDAKIAAKRGTSNEEAYSLYLQGRTFSMRRSPEGREKSIEHFKRAIELDPNYALAYARMAHVIQDPEQAKELVKKALELDPELAEAYVSRADIRMLDEWDFVGAERDVIRAIELEPNNDTAHWLYGLLLTNRGRIDEGLREVDMARSIDPGAVMYMFHRGRVLYYARRYQEAITQFKQASDIDDRFVQPYGWASRVYENLGDYEKAYLNFIEREARSPRRDNIQIFKDAYAAGGWTAVRLKSTEDGTQAFDLARLHALQGEKDAAFENLEKSFQARSWLMITMKVEPAFDNLRDDPRFTEFLTRVGI